MIQLQTDLAWLLLPFTPGSDKSLQLFMLHWSWSFLFGRNWSLDTQKFRFQRTVNNSDNIFKEMRPGLFKPTNFSSIRF